MPDLGDGVEDGEMRGVSGYASTPWIPKSSAITRRSMQRGGFASSLPWS